MTAPSTRKAQTSEAIRRAALDLFAAGGYDETTASDVAEAAGVSERTFFRHFPTKEDVAFPGHDTRLDVLRDALAARPAGEPIMQSVWAALLSLADEFEAHRDDLVRMQPIIASSHALTARSVELQAAYASLISEHVARRLGLDPVTDLLPNLVGQVVIGAVSASIATWLAAGASDDLVALVRRSLHLLDQGFGPGASPPDTV